MIFNEEKLNLLLENRKDIRVKKDDEYSFCEPPSILDVQFVISIIIESLFNTEGEVDEVKVDFTSYEKSLFLFCSIFNEGDVQNLQIKMTVDTPLNLGAAYYMCRFGKEEMTEYELEVMTRTIKSQCKYIWPETFKNME